MQHGLKFWGTPEKDWQWLTLPFLKLFTNIAKKKGWHYLNYFMFKMFKNKNQHTTEMEPCSINSTDESIDCGSMPDEHLLYDVFKPFEASCVVLLCSVTVNPPSSASIVFKQLLRFLCDCVARLVFAACFLNCFVFRGSDKRRVKPPVFCPVWKSVLLCVQDT